MSDTIITPAPAKRTVHELNGLLVELLDGSTLEFQAHKLKYTKFKEIQSMRLNGVEYDPETLKPESSSIGTIMLNTEKMKIELAKVVFGLPADFDFDSLEIEDCFQLIDLIDEAGFLARMG